MENLDQLKEFLAVPRDIVITAHRNPDGDAIGSSLALAHYLKQKQHSIHVVFPSEYPANVAWMPGASDITIYDVDPPGAEEKLKRAEIVFCLDFNALDRIDKMGELLHQLTQVKIVMIDHHLDPEPFAEFALSRPSASSTCELIYDFIHLMGEQRYLNLEVASCIYAGLLTDTGSFQYNTSPDLMFKAGKLLELGLDDYAIHDQLFNALDEKHLRLLGHCLANRMTVYPEFSTAMIYLTRSDYERYDIQRGDTEGIVNYLLKMKHIRMAAFITEQPTIVKISLRSKGEVSVQEMARKHFKGGGHKNASGGYSYIGLRATLHKFREMLPEYAAWLAPDTPKSADA